MLRWNRFHRCHGRGTGRHHERVAVDGERDAVVRASHVDFTREELIALLIGNKHEDSGPLLQAAARDVEGRFLDQLLEVQVVRVGGDTDVWLRLSPSRIGRTGRSRYRGPLTSSYRQTAEAAAV